MSNHPHTGTSQARWSRPWGLGLVRRWFVVAEIEVRVGEGIFIRRHGGRRERVRGIEVAKGLAEGVVRGRGVVYRVGLGL